MHRYMMKLVGTGFAAFFAIATGVSAHASTIVFEFENLAPESGLFLTPLWTGFHDGGFDLFNVGDAASSGLERLAEDGNPAVLSADLAAAQTTSVSGVILGPAGFPGAPVLDPGETGTGQFELDPTDNRYFSYASMVIPSNDAFIGSDTALELFDAFGDFVGETTFIIYGNFVFDAGTEQNTEMDAAFLNQTGPDMGLTEMGVIGVHPGFLTVGGLILGGTTAAGTLIDPVLGNFALGADTFEIARITFRSVPEPASLALIGFALPGIALARRRRSRSKVKVA